MRAPHLDGPAVAAALQGVCGARVRRVHVEQVPIGHIACRAVADALVSLPPAHRQPLASTVLAQLSAVGSVPPSALALVRFASDA